MLSLGLLIFTNSRNNGVFDEEDLIFRTKQLYTFLDESAKENGFDRGNVIAIGYPMVLILLPVSYSTMGMH